MRRKPSVKAHGRIVSWEGATLWMLAVEPGAQEFPPTGPHAHHAVQVTLALRGRFDLLGERLALRGALAAAIAPDAPHAFHQPHGLVAHLFLAPESRAGRAIAGSLFADARLRRLSTRALGDLPVRLAAAFARGASAEAELVELGRAVVARLAGEGPGTRPDGRVEQVIAWATRQLDGPVTLESAAEAVSLSPGRFRHLFVAQTGIPFRVFLLWLRLTKAVELHAGGASLTDAAHAAGFADSAHLSRTFRRMYGLAAASLRLA
jgi:AraC-like DNA-binding protein